MTTNTAHFWLVRQAIFHRMQHKISLKRVCHASHEVIIKHFRATKATTCLVDSYFAISNQLLNI